MKPTKKQVLSLGCIVCLNSRREKTEALILMSRGKVLPLCDEHLLGGGTPLWESRHGTVASLHEQVVCMLTGGGFHDRNRMNQHFRTPR